MHEEALDSTYERVSEVIPSESREDETSTSTGIFGKIGQTLGSVGKMFMGSDNGPPTPKQEKAVKIDVIRGDILSSKCEVMVNTTGSDFNLTKSRVSQALVKKSGPEMIQECAKKPIEKTKILRVTNAPNLSFKYVVHLVSPHSASKLTEHVLEALTIVETKLKCSSIALPAIGTGQIEMDDAAAARYVRKAIDVFRKTDPKFLKQINVVVFEPRMLGAFKTAMSGSALAAEKQSKSNKAKQVSSLPSFAPAPPLQRGNVAVNVTGGDIFASNCEVLINTTGNDYNLYASLLSKLLIQKGGNSIVTECQSNPVLTTNECRVTGGGKTQFQNVVHFITPQVHVLAQSLQSVLDLINNKLMKSSVTIPAIGTGQAGLPADQVAKAFQQAISNFIAGNPSHLKRIDIVIFDKQHLKTFQSNINYNPAAVTSSSVDPGTATTDSKQLQQTPGRSRIEALETKIDRSHQVMVYFTSNSKANNKRAWQAISEKAHKKSLTVKIYDEVLELLDDVDLLDLKEIEREFNVCIKLPEDDSENQFDIWGLRNSVTDAQKFILNRLHKYNQAATLSEYLKWKYEDPSKSGNWKEFALLNNFELNSSYKEDSSTATYFKIKMNGKKQNLFVDFGKMEMKNEDSSNTYSIKQFTDKGSVFPSHWDGKKFRQLIKLDSQSKEYQDVLNKFTSSAGGFPYNTIIQIDRVENKRQYTQFLAQKQDIELRMKTNQVNLPVTRELFHGTSSSICDQIYKGGFDRSYAGKNATVYGVGVYFATTSQYSHRYTDLQGGSRKMFLADVITGQFALGNQNMRVPPPLPGSTTDNHDSVVDNVNTPSMFVVFKDASVYPLYIVTYT